MRILIATGLSSTDVGGPAQYASNMGEELILMGHKVRYVRYGRTEKGLPIGIRHFYFFIKTLPKAFCSDMIIALDTFSVGVPTLWAGRALRKKTVVRIGGDFLWESYVNRTSKTVSLPEFYEKGSSLNRKEKIILYFTNLLVRKAHKLAFNTEWQRKIWTAAYGIPQEKTAIIQNYIPPKMEAPEPTKHVFLWAGRESKVKNLDMLREVGNKIKNTYPKFSIEFITNASHEDLIEKIKDSYAVILPSFSDVCPNFILEAASFNRPFIMTKETGLNEIYPQGGLFIDSRSSAELASAIESMLQPNEYARLAAQLRSIRPEHSWQEVAREFINI